MKKLSRQKQKVSAPGSHLINTDSTSPLSHGLGVNESRNMCHSTNVATMAKKRTESIDSVVVDYLENIATPHRIGLSAFSGEGARDRSDALW